jgi:hypothetical protein
MPHPVSVPKGLNKRSQAIYCLATIVQSLRDDIFAYAESEIHDEVVPDARHPKRLILFRCVLGKVHQLQGWS